eukprot:TRINITY_DN6027_c0_g1_i1.p1 TRINITY_DN6027_c0_g1~~TRINITY_DN6027_c0_g1_i1.p1  ORF type:complete len:365 (-),score=151.61 TRINITY_DN6027_c0_g1_i1:1190-2284(-)
MGILEKIKDIETEISRTQKNKATEYHLGLLKAKLARYRSQLLEGPKTSKGGGEGFEVLKAGDGRVAMVGFPSVGKSTLLSTLTDTESAIASYEFTTLTCVPGNIIYKGAKIQLLDLPGIIEGAAGGKGRGRQVISVARTADVILMMLDASKGDVQKGLLQQELESVGIRLNATPPNIYFKQKSGGGLSINSTVPLTHIDDKMVRTILHEYRIFNAEILFKCDATVDEFVDVVEGNRSYLRCVYVYNKIDCLSVEELDKFARQPDSIVVSCNLRLNLDNLLRMIWEYMGLVRVYTKRRGAPPDFSDAIVLRNGATVEDVCGLIHKDLKNQFKYALVWGTSAKHTPQKVGLAQELEDEDVIMVCKK